jgi:hypothetical protein
LMERRLVERSTRPLFSIIVHLPTATRLLFEMVS